MNRGEVFDTAIRAWLDANPQWCIELRGQRIIAAPRRSSGLVATPRDLYMGTCAGCPNRESLSGCALPCDGDRVLR